MAFDLSLFSSKLKRYREQFQWSLDEVSQATGISQRSLSELENGQRRPTGDEILILADYYRCDYKFFLSNEKLASFEQTETLFRRYGKDFSKQDRWSVQEFLFLCECEEFLMKLLPGHERKPLKNRELTTRDMVNRRRLNSEGILGIFPRKSIWTFTKTSGV